MNRRARRSDDTARTGSETINEGNQEMSDKGLKLWQFAMAVVVQLLIFGFWAGSQAQYQKELGARLTELSRRVEANSAEITRIDINGSSQLRASAASEHRSADKLDARIGSIEAQMSAINIKLERLLAVYERRGVGEK